MTSLHTTVEAQDVYDALDNLATLLSPSGLIAFLGGHVGPYLSRRAEDRFASEGDDVTGPWKPLSEATIRLRAEQGFAAGPINHRTGELEDWVVDGGWFAYPVGEGATLRFPGQNPTGELRSKVQTAQGGRAKPMTDPRPVLGVNEVDLLFMQSSLMAAIEVAIS